MITVFYANLVYDHYPNWTTAKHAVPDEVYQGGFMYNPNAKTNQWGRLDGTPVLDSDVPAVLKAWTLLLD